MPDMLVLEIHAVRCFDDILKAGMELVFRRSLRGL